jgi:hypothetical protein
MNVRIFYSKKDHPLLDKVESWNLADLQIDNQNQKKKPKTLKILP